MPIIQIMISADDVREGLTYPNYSQRQQSFKFCQSGGIKTSLFSSGVEAAFKQPSHNINGTRIGNFQPPSETDRQTSGVFGGPFGSNNVNFNNSLAGVSAFGTDSGLFGRPLFAPCLTNGFYNLSFGQNTDISFGSLSYAPGKIYFLYCFFIIRIFHS